MGGLRRPWLRKKALFRVLALLVLAGLILFARAGLAQTTYQEADVKAAIIARVIGFIRWEEEGSPAPRARPIQLTVLGDPALAARLNVLRGLRSSQERPFDVEALDKPEPRPTCDVLFIGRSQGARIEEITSALGQARTLTMADTPGAATRGVAINLYSENRRIRLEINPQALKRARLTASYQLMSLSRIVNATGGAR